MWCIGVSRAFSRKPPTICRRIRYQVLQAASTESLALGEKLLDSIQIWKARSIHNISFGTCVSLTLLNSYKVKTCPTSKSPKPLLVKKGFISYNYFFNEATWICSLNVVNECEVKNSLSSTIHIHILSKVDNWLCLLFLSQTMKLSTSKKNTVKTVVYSFYFNRYRCYKLAFFYIFFSHLDGAAFPVSGGRESPEFREVLDAYAVLTGRRSSEQLSPEVSANATVGPLRCAKKTCCMVQGAGASRSTSDPFSSGYTLHVSMLKCGPENGANWVAHTKILWHSPCQPIQVWPSSFHRWEDRSWARGRVPEARNALVDGPLSDSLKQKPPHPQSVGLMISHPHKHKWANKCWLYTKIIYKQKV